MTAAGLTVDVSTRLDAFHLEMRLEVARGETVAVLGPNGAGKTTLLGVIAGLVPIGTGTLALDGVILEDSHSRVFVEPERRPIGVVFQNYLLFEHLDALDNVAFGLRCRGVNKRDARRRAHGWLERMGLAGQASSRPGQLSGGQAQRVALARALAIEPRVLLLDEPLSALDATSRATTRRDLRLALGRYEGVRVLVTHDPVEAAALADRLVVLEAGRVVQAGTPAEISAHPRSPYVADLVGVNLLRGRGHHDRVAIGPASLTVATPVEGEVIAVIHPRAVTLHLHAPEGSARNVWPGTVLAIDRGPDRVRVEIGGSPSVVAEVTQRSLDDLGLTRGSSVWVSVKATEILVFPG